MRNARKLIKMVGAYYSAYKTARELGDSKLEVILSDRLEKILKDLVCCFNTDKMYSWEEYLKFFGIDGTEYGGNVVEGILDDVAEIMN